VAIPLVALNIAQPDIGNTFLTARDTARANTQAEAQAAASSAETQAKARTAKLGQLANMAFRVAREAPENRPRLLQQAKIAAMQLYGDDPQVRSILDSVTPDNVEGYATALTGIKEQLDAGKTDADIANIYNTMGTGMPTRRA
jgi:hypothetical protein